MTEENKEQPILATLDNKGLHLAHESVTAALEKKKISASMITGIEKCPASWAADTFIIRDLVEQEPDNAARRGSMFHKVMEHLFALEPEARTKEAMKEMVKRTLAEEEFADLAQLKEPVAWLRDAINGYYQMGGKPETVQVATIQDGEKERLGLEVFVKGRIGEANRDTLGFIDRLIKNTKLDDDSVFIEDWKSGAKAKKWNPKTKGDDGLAEARQQVIYAILLEEMGVKVSGARLIFPVAREIVTVDLKDQNFRNRVIQDVEDTDRKLDTFIENNTFEFKPNFLCSWCPLSRACPKADLKTFAKARDAQAKQPTLEVLAKGIEFL